ncbi:NucA/NucB deoxyribonuclease domain-containing protein [Amycolatopsis sp. NPDC049868]|uniref:NucA/NucB deoxyribonuclease domain-containing protein n=1 Tax=Amycolatopsis sp. NPDC049868 TaxID=3363934 RepID=UPI003787D6CD
MASRRRIRRISIGLVVMLAAALSPGASFASADDGPSLRVEITDLNGKKLDSLPDGVSPPAPVPSIEDAQRRGAELGNFSSSKSGDKADDERIQKALDEISNYRPPSTGRTHELKNPDRPIDPFLLDLCMRDPRAEGTQGHVFHRNFWCHRSGIQAVAWDKRTGRVLGSAKLAWDAVGLGNRHSRELDVFLRPTAIKDNWGVYQNLDKFKLSVGPQCGAPTVGCSVDYPAFNATGDIWKNRIETKIWLWWGILSDESKSTETDKVSNHRWYFSTSSEILDRPADTGRFDFPPNDIRCDSATYFPNETVACVNSNVLSYLTYWTNNPNYNEGEVALHIRQAQDLPNTTFPPRDYPKRIPGKYTYPIPDAPPLHRIPGDEEGANRAEVRRTCDVLRVQQPPKPGEECDEYPFASTREGAASTHNDFSVKYVDGTQNSSAGGSLIQWYTRERMMYKDQDRFWVEIKSL